MLSRNSLALVVFFTLVWTSLLGCKKTTEQSLTALAKEMRQVSGFQPQLELAVDWKALREADALQNFFVEHRKRLEAYFFRRDGKKKGCDPVRFLALVDKLTALFLADFQVSYIILEGPFQALPHLQCLLKQGASPVQINGVTVFPSQTGYWWVAGKNRIVGVTENEDSNHWFQTKSEVVLGGSTGLVSKILARKELLRKGPSMSFRKASVVMRLHRLRRLKAPFRKGFALAHSMVGSFWVNKQLSFDLKFVMSHARSAGAVIQRFQEWRRKVFGVEDAGGVKQNGRVLSLRSSLSLKPFLRGLKEDLGRLSRYVRELRRSGVREHLLRISQASVSFYKKQHFDAEGKPLPKHFPGVKFSAVGEPTTYKTPTAKPCTHGKVFYPDNFKEWNKQPWKSLDFQIEGKHPYQYVFTTSGVGRKAEFTIRAHADLDCDGVLSTFQMNGSVVVRSGEVFVGKLVANKPDE